MKQVDILQIEDDWYEILKKYFISNYFKETMKILKQELESQIVYPKIPDIFKAYNSTSFEKVKVVIIGQDPYINPEEAHGLVFSVPEERNIKLIPPSLKNIFKELDSDLTLDPPSSGCLQSWADQGILLINSILTVRKGQSGSHSKIGWQILTDYTIKQLSDHGESGIVFLLWGNYAKEKEKLINVNKHYTLKAAHPSPFSANYGFFGCKHFSKTNKILAEQNKKEIDWQI
jgi:uracil-DNA glycosylase